MEPLTFKIITDADDRGVRNYEKSLSNVDITGRKASGALKQFVSDLGQAQSATDVTSSALSAMARILGTSIGATAVVVVGKALVDAFIKVNEIVKESTKSVEAANKEILKIGMSGASFETSSKQADILYKTTENLRKSLEKINESKLQSFIAGLTGAREKTEELITSTEKQADALQRQAIAQRLLELERNATLDETTKKIAAQQKPYQELFAIAIQLKDVDLQRAVIQASQAAAQAIQVEEQTKLELAAQEERKKAEEARIKERNKLEEDAAKQREKIFNAEEKARADAYMIEAKFIADLRKQELDRIKEIDKQLEAIDKRKKAIETEIGLLLQRNAAESAGYGGTSRGPGAPPTSFQSGLEDKLLRERYKAIRDRDNEYFNFVRDKLKAQGQDYGNWATQNEIARLAVKEQRDSILAGNEAIKKLKQESENLKKEQENLKNETDNLKKSLEKTTENSDEIGKSFSEQAKDFTVEGENMVEKVLDAGKGMDDLATTAIPSTEESFGMLDDQTVAATNALSNFQSKLDSFLPPGGGGGEGSFATESTLSAVLGLLTETLTELKTYAHAGAGS